MAKNHEYITIESYEYITIESLVALGHVDKAKLVIDGVEFRVRGKIAGGLRLEKIEDGQT